MKNKIKVLVVDDSALVRRTLENILAMDSGIEVIGSATNPYIAADIMKKDIPDVITLDIEMPQMDGLTFLKKIMAQHPIPVVVISTLTSQNSEITFKALEYGAVEIIQKPKLNTKTALKEARIRICDTVKAASMTRVKRKVFLNKNKEYKRCQNNTSAVKQTTVTPIKTTDKIVAIGASTGGTETLKLFLEEMPYDCPGILIVQHMPEVFTTQFAKRLNNQCRIQVKEADSGDSVLRGQALIAPGNMHMRLKRSGTKYYVELQQGELVNRHRPSVDVLFHSVALSAGSNAFGVIMTGMGKDGARGIKAMKESGAYTIAQNKESCAVYGMPKEAIKLNAIDKVLHIKEIARHMLLKQ